MFESLVIKLTRADTDQKSFLTYAKIVGKKFVNNLKLFNPNQCNILQYSYISKFMFVSKH